MSAVKSAGAHDERLLSGAEAIAACLVSTAAVTIVAAYFVDLAGAAFTPARMWPFTLGAAAAIAVWLGRQATWRARDVWPWALVVGGVMAWLIAIARPWGLPIGTGPDLTHHLLLIDYFERHWRLVHDPAVGPVLGEMTHYTPGLHMLAALVGGWSRQDGLHVLHALVSASVALKCGFVFLIARRVLRGGTPRVPFAVLAVLLLALPKVYVLDSFLRESFLAQVVSECFAVGMWWALAVWDDRPSTSAAALFALAGCGAFLTWPIWIGPPIAAFGLTWLMRREPRLLTRLLHGIVAIAPIAVVAVLYVAGRLEWLRMTSTGGEVLRPTVAAFGAAFLAVSAAGVIAAAVTRQARATVALLAATALQAMALFARAPAGDPAALYMTFKTFYLFPYPMAVCAVLAIALAWRRLAAWVPIPRDLRHRAVTSAVAASLLVVLAGHRLVRPLFAERRPPPPLSEPIFLAGRWARDHLPPQCVGYMVPDDDTAYWLHLAVLRNSRSADRTNDDATYSIGETVARWYAPGGPPYAIADLTALGRDVRADLDVMAQFGTAAVIRKRGGVCPEAPSAP